MILSGARTAVGELLDDASNVRWSTAQVDAALSFALALCLTYYKKNGAGRFDLEVTGNTSATTGALSIASSVPLGEPSDVMLVVGNVSYRIEPKQANRRGYIDLTARALRITYMQEYALSTTSSDPLVGVAAVAANSWPAFDNWICVEAAYLCGLKDLEDARLSRLREQADLARAAAVDQRSGPGGYPIPRQEWRYFNEPLRWSWVPSTSTICLFRVWP